MFSIFHTCLALLLAAQISHAAVPPAVFSKTLIVEDLKKCPVKSVAFDPKDFDAEQVANLVGIIQTPEVTNACQTAAIEKLVYCYTDSDTMSSLKIMTGCCSKACATAIEESVKSGCFAQYIKVICNDPASKSMQLGLGHTAKRCANYDAACPATTAARVTATTAVNATAAANTTMTAKSTNATPVSAKSAEPAAAEPAASATAPAPATAKNNAVDVAAATYVSFVMAAAVLLLAVH